MSEFQQQTPSSRSGLLKAFNIGFEDIAANRAGRLSLRQTTQLRNSAALNVVGAVVIVAFLGAILLFVSAKPLLWYQFVLVGALMVAGAAVGAYTVRGLLAATQAGVTYTLAGPITLRLRRNNGWWLTVQGESFRLPVQYWHVSNGTPYLVYIAPAARRIVAMELLHPSGTD